MRSAAVSVPACLTLRGGSGLGDAIYLQSVARHFVPRYREVVVRSWWREVFLPLPVRVDGFYRHADIIAHYSQRRWHSETDQFEDCCIAARIKGPVPLDLDWKLREPNFVAPLLACGKPLVAVQLPRLPMNRIDGVGASLLPDCRVIQKLIDLVAPHVGIVQIGKGIPLFQFANVEFDLSNVTTVSQLLDVASVCSGFIGYVSFMVPLSESLAKPALYVWAREGLRATDFVSTITPRKILHRKDLSSWIVDDCSNEQLERAAHSFLEQIGVPALV